MSAVGQPAAKQGDQVLGVDIHLVVLPPPASGSVPLPHPFSGQLMGALSTDVTIMGKPAAVVGSTATNSPAHVPTAPGVSFAKPPTNQASVATGSPTVLINGKQAARAGDPARTCNDPVDLSTGTVVATGTVLIG